MTKFKSVIGCCLFFATAYYLFPVACFSQDMRMRLTSTDGSTSFQVQNAADVGVATITSRGEAIFLGSATVQGGSIKLGTASPAVLISSTQTGTPSSGLNISTHTKVDGQLIVTGSTTIQGIDGLTIGTGGRRITDDSSRGETRFSSSVYIVGDLYGGGNVRMPVVVSSSARATDWVDSADNTTDTDVEGMSVTLNVPFAPALIFGQAVIRHNGGGGGVEIQVTHLLNIAGNVVSEAGYHGHTGTNDAKHHTASVSGAWRVTSPGNYIVKAQYRVGGGTGFWSGPRNILAYALPTQ